MPKLIFPNEGVTFEVAAGTNLRQAALAQGINIYPPLCRLLNCRGHGLCGTCKVEVSDPNALEPASKTKSEKRHTFDVPEWSKIRLACQVRVAKDLVVKTHPRLPLGWYAYPTYEHLRKS